jgi:osmotically-inducible protein OsmY
MVFTIGADVHCPDGRCGRLEKVVIDPHTERVTDLIVEKGFLQKEDRILPIDVVAEADEEEIHLSVGSDRLSDYRIYEEAAFVRPAAGWESGSYTGDQVRYWVPQQGLVIDEAIVPRTRRRVRIGVAANERLIERGTPVHGRGRKKLGEVDHVLVKPENGEISRLVVRRGLVPEYRLIPFDEVEEVSEEIIYTELTEDEVSELPRYQPRQSEDVLQEIGDRLEEATLDFSEVQAAVREGVARLTGTVGDVAAKRRAEATARNVEGVVDVENVLHTDTAVAARVEAALADDPRTSLAVIDVTSQHGVVTLRGSVDSPEISEAAEEIAEAQSGVVEVVNALEVDPDEDASVLAFIPFLKDHRGGYDHHQVP